MKRFYFRLKPAMSGFRSKRFLLIAAVVTVTVGFQTSLAIAGNHDSKCHDDSCSVRCGGYGVGHDSYGASDDGYSASDDGYCEAGAGKDAYCHGKSGRGDCVERERDDDHGKKEERDRDREKRDAGKKTFPKSWD